MQRFIEERRHERKRYKIRQEDRRCQDSRRHIEGECGHTGRQVDREEDHGQGHEPGSCGEEGRRSGEDLHGPGSSEVRRAGSKEVRSINQIKDRQRRAAGECSFPTGKI